MQRIHTCIRSRTARRNYYRGLIIIKTVNQVDCNKLTVFQYQLRSSMALHTHPNIGWCPAVNLACIYSDCSYEGSHHSLASHYLTEHELGLEELVKTVLI